MRKVSIVVALATLGFVLTGTAEAITFGHRDGGRHPNVGALTKLNGKGNKGWICSGTLIASKVVLTAAHCTEFLNPRKPLWVTFEPEFDRGGVFYSGAAVTNPNFLPNLTNDIGLVLLDRTPAGIQPARLPDARLLETMKRRGELKRTIVTTWATAARPSSRTILRRSATTASAGIPSHPSAGSRRTSSACSRTIRPRGWEERASATRAVRTSSGGTPTC
jgi:hypothetical protein